VIRQAALVPFLVVEQIEQGDVQVAQQDIADLRGQNPYPLQHIVQVGLRDAGAAGEATFGQLPPLHPILHMRDEPKLQQFKIHEVRGPDDFALK